jgi:hypothetical protein
MRRKTKSRKIGRAKTRLGLPNLDQSKAAVIGSLRSLESQRGYRHAIDEFINWYCSEPRLSFNRSVVLRYRIYLESRNLAPATINVRLAAVRRLSYEAAPTPVCSARNLLLVSVALGVQRSSAFGWETGCPQPKPVHCGSVPGWNPERQARRAIIAVLVGCGIGRASN